MHVTNQVTRNYATLGLSINLSRHCYFSLRDYRFDRLQTLYYIRYYAMSYVFTKQSQSFLDEFIIARYTINFRSTCDRLYMVSLSEAIGLTDVLITIFILVQLPSLVFS